jgi:hypothetical protein
MALPLRERESERDDRCRCGRPIRVGEAAWRFVDPPESVASLLSEERFCSILCVRASLLESLELFETSAAAAVVQDVSDVLGELRRLYLRVVAGVPNGYAA